MNHILGLGMQKQILKYVTRIGSTEGVQKEGAPTRGIEGQRRDKLKCRSHNVASIEMLCVLALFIVRIRRKRNDLIICK